MSLFNKNERKSSFSSSSSNIPLAHNNSNNNIVNIQQNEIPLDEIKASGIENDNYDIDLSPSQYPWYTKLFYKITGKDNFVGVSRKIYIDDQELNGNYRYCNNYVKTAKYTILTFLPKNLLEQFTRAANCYFLVISGLQLIPGVSPTGRFTTLGPLLVVLAITALKEAYEDYNRHKQDDKVNHSKTLVLKNSNWVEVKWQDVQVGDIVKVKNKEYVPADMLLLSSSEPQSMGYIETANLDGETNLKIRQGLDETAYLADDTNRLSAIRGTIIKCEHPNNKLYNFTGTVELSDKLVPIGVKHVLLRGAMLRNTKWVNGSVIFSGKDTKLMRNSSGTPSKKSQVEVYTNYFIIIIFTFQLLISALCAVGNGSFVKDNYLASYFQFDQDPAQIGALSFITFIILFNNLIPISLYVSLEIIKVFQAHFINSDIEMYHAETDTPALARTSNINEELGLVSHVFSDKTGTLTQNKMVFKKCTIGGVSYGNGITEATQGKLIREGKKPSLSQIPIPSSSSSNNNNNNNGHKLEQHFSHIDFDDNSLLQNLQHHSTQDWIREFLVVLSVCHTVIPELEEGEIVYQASSPDEGALVNAAKFFGVEFTKRTTTSVWINYRGEELRYDVLNILEFNSNRKRMSVIVKTPEGKIVLYCKGADSVIFERLAPNQPFADITINHLQEFASEGLRTLCIAKVELDEKLYSVWAQEYFSASTMIVNREASIDSVAEKIEKSLSLIGATAIEDKLQEGVPETIAELSDAGIKIWVLTGDKQETAINIGYSCRLLNPDMELIIINEQSKENTIIEVNRRLSDLRATSIEIDSQKNNLALIIDGATLHYILGDKFETSLLKLAKFCRSVICCRVTPKQKSQVVELVRNNLDDVTLAIGDGANDVNMIQTAHIGVGISGEEGLQAARSADFAIAQFRFLSRLLLVHGRYNYRRVAKLINYCFYKNITLFLTQFFFSMVNGFSGQTLYERFTLTAYNVAWTLFPILAFGIFDKDISEEMCRKSPPLYMKDRSKIFRFTTLLSWCLNGLYHSGLLFLFTWLLGRIGSGYSVGRPFELFELGTITYSCVVLTVNLKLAIETRYWTWVSHLTIWGSIIVYFLWLVIFGKFFEFESFDVGSDLYEVIYHLGSNGTFYFCIILFPAMALYKDFTWKYLNRELRTSSYHGVQEMQKFPKLMDSSNKKLYTGYAFSQESQSDNIKKENNNIDV